MIARIWRGWTSTKDAGTYAEYVQQTGIQAYRRTPGNQGAWILQRAAGDRTEIVTLSFWDSMDAIARFAGRDVSQAVFYPEDDKYLIDRDLTVTHYEISGPSDGGRAI
jgi:heme-degrading monooxygenase HmoA